MITAGELKMPSLFSYTDYREYLHDLIEATSHNGEKIPMQQFAKAFGLGRSHLSMVLSGERVLTLRHIHEIARALHFDQSDHEYWEALVLSVQAKDERERNYYQRKMELKRVDRTTRLVIATSTTLVSQWYIPAVLVYLRNIGNTPNDRVLMAKKLGIDLSALNETINELEKEGFLSFSEHGSIHISFNRIVSMVSSKKYLKSVFDKGVQLMDKNFLSQQYLFNGATLDLTEDDIHQFIADYKSLLERYFRSEGRGTKQVVQANIQFFPVL